MKRMLVLLTVLGAAFAAVAMVATGAPAPKATGDYGFQFPAGGLQRHLTFNAIQSTTDTCGTFWNVTGVHSMSFTLDPNPGFVASHDVTLTQSGESVSGSGGNPPGASPYAYAWHVTSGSVVGNALTLAIVYDGGPDAVGTIWNINGTIAANGSISGTWNDNYPPPNGSRSGTFVANGGATGVATPYASYCGNGTAYYTDANNDWYFMNVKAVSVSGNTAWYAAQIIASSPDLGFENSTTNYLFVRVVDNAEPGIGHDVTGGDLMTPAGALAAVAAHSVPASNATINVGNIQVH